MPDGICTGKFAAFPSRPHWGKAASRELIRGKRQINLRAADLD